MGMHNFETVIWHEGAMDEAYWQANAEATSEYGTDPYNGTISTTDGVQLSPWRSETVPLEDDPALIAFTSERLDHLQKWDVCEAVRVRESIPARTEHLGRVRLNTTLTVEEYADTDKRHANLKRAAQETIDATVRKAKRTGNPAKVTFQNHLRGVTRECTLDSAIRVSQPQVAEVLSARYTTRATEGKAETRYFILKRGDVSGQQMPKWEDGHATQAKARAALPKTSITGAEQYEIIGMTRRVGGAPLVEHAAVPSKSSKVSLCVDVNLERVITPAHAGERTGWLFYGWAAR